MPGPTPTLQRELTGDRLLERIQDHVRDALQQLVKNVPLLGGVLVRSVTLQPNQDNQVTHSLNRSPSGFLLCGGNRAGIVYESTATNSYRSAQLLLRTSATQTHTVTLWFF